METEIKAALSTALSTTKLLQRSLENANQVEGLYILDLIAEAAKLENRIEAFAVALEADHA